MAQALLATAIAQGLLAVAALTLWGHEPPGRGGILMLNLLFAALFLGSAWLFWRSAQTQEAVLKD
jgi:hypothetical protein